MRRHFLELSPLSNLHALTLRYELVENLLAIVHEVCVSSTAELRIWPSIGIYQYILKER